MSQIQVNNTINSVNVESTINTVNVDQNCNNTLVIPQDIVTVVEIVTPGPQGPPGIPGDINLLTSSFVTTSSFNAFTSSYNTGSFTGSFAGNGSGLLGIVSSSYAFNSTTASFALNFNPDATASYAVSASQAVNSDTSSFQTNIEFAISHVPVFNTDYSISSSNIRQVADYELTINREINTLNAPEALFVFQPNTESINIITAAARVDDYVQINIKNESSGSDASADIVATADNGDEFVNYVNMGINSSTFAGSIGGPNDAYFYSTGNDLTIGNATANKHVRFFTGGGLVENFQKLVLNPDDLHEMTGSLDIEGALIVTDGITGSLEGTASYAITASYALNVPETASFAISASQALTASYALEATTASYALNSLSSSYALKATTASYAITASYVESSSYAINSDTSSFQSNIEYAITHIPVFNTDNSISSSNMRQLGDYELVINREFNTLNFPEALFVFQPNTESINIITAAGNIDSYAQVNVKNENSGSDASADVVATADNGDEYVNYIDMGINSSTFTGVIGGPNDAYIYSTGNDLTIGNATANKHIRFFTGGGLVPVYQKFVLNPDDLHEMTGSLDILGNLTVSNPITGSLNGTASYADNSLSASYAVTTSYADNFTVVGTLTAQTIVVQTITSSTDYVTGSTIFGSELTNTHQFTGSVTITGSLAVNDDIVVVSSQTGSFATTGSNYFSGSQSIEGNVSITGSLVISQNLVVSGTASFQNVSSLEIADRFVLFASGSNTTGPGGIVVQQDTQGIGELYSYDNISNRWGFTSSFNSTNQTLPVGYTASAYAGTVQVGFIGDITGSSPIYGGATYGQGTIFIDTSPSSSNGEIWIFA